MSLVRWAPFRELEDMQSRLNRLFDDAASPRIEREALSFAGWSPAVDVQETDQEYVIKADLPDVQKEDVKVALLDGTLTIEGERQQEKEENGRKFHKIEREYGRFLRRFSLPAEVDAGKVQAEFKNGVLNVHLPKSVTAKPKAIEVKVN
jgi:HSP20 family protein